MTLKEFIKWLFEEDSRCPSPRDVWMFEGAWISGNLVSGEHEFPMTQGLARWHEGYASFTHLKEKYR